MCPELDDDTLIKAAQRGDTGALNALLRRHFDRIYAICRRLAGNDADAADATQEALIAITRGIERFDGRASFSTWSYRVATNACLDELRRRGRRPTPSLVDEHDGWADRHAESRVTSLISTPTSMADRVDDRLRIDDALAQLPDEFRAPVVLRDQLGLDYREIAEVLDIAPGTVRSRIARGRRKLADLLKDPETGNQTPSEQRQSDST